MADNTVLPVGSGGVTIATDDIGGVKYQRIKLIHGADNVNAGDVAAANPLPMADTDAEFGLSVGVTSLRDKVMAQRYTILADSIADGLASFWTFTTSGTGSVAMAIGEGLIQTGTAVGAAAQMLSTAPAYYPGQVHWLNSAIRFDTPAVGATLRIGPCTVQGTTPWDGGFYELNDTTLNIVTVKLGVRTVVASTAWSRFASAPFTLDTNYHQFEVRWTANRMDFLVDNSLRHTASGGATTLTGTLNFPMLLQAINVSGSSNRALGVRNIGIGRFGTPPPLTAVSTTLTGGGYAAAVDSHNQMQINGIALDQLVRLSAEQLRQLTKISLILSSMSGITVEDDDIEVLTY